MLPYTQIMTTNPDITTTFQQALYMTHVIFEGQSYRSLTDVPGTKTEVFNLSETDCLQAPVVILEWQLYRCTFK